MPRSARAASRTAAPGSPCGEVAAGGEQDRHAGSTLSLGQLGGAVELVRDVVAVGALAVVALLDDHEVVVAVHGPHPLVGVGGLVALDEELLVVEAVDEVLDEVHRRARRARVELAAPGRPVGRLGVLDAVDRAVGQQREEDPERLAHVGRDVAAVVDDDERGALLVDDAVEDLGVGLVAEVGVDVPLGQPGLVLDVEADDAGPGEEPAPHLHRGAAAATLLVAADARARAG